MTDPTSIYDIPVTTIDGTTTTLSEYRGRVMLIVNVASRCGFTSQYSGLEELYQRYKDRGLVILGFPCNQFGNQEPGSNDEIKQFCTTRYTVTFPMFAKIDVNGSAAHPLYRYLKSKRGGWFGSAIKWNFTKFLVDQHGQVVQRYGSMTTPSRMEKDIESLLAQPKESPT